MRLAAVADRGGELAQALGDLLVGLEVAAPEEQRRVAVALDDVGVVLVHLLELRDRLQDGRDVDPARAQGRDLDVEVGDAADVGELVEDAVHGNLAVRAGVLVGDGRVDVEQLVEQHRRMKLNVLSVSDMTRKNAVGSWPIASSSSSSSLKNSRTADTANGARRTLHDAMTDARSPASRRST